MLGAYMYPYPRIERDSLIDILCMMMLMSSDLRSVLHSKVGSRFFRCLAQGMNLNRSRLDIPDKASRSARPVAVLVDSVMATARDTDQV